MTNAPVAVDTPYGVFVANDDDLITRLHLSSFGGHAGGELALVADAITEGDVVLDVGAHIGTFSVAMGRATGPSGRLYCFEPSAASYELLELNLELNGLAGMSTLRQFGVAPSSDWELVTPDAQNTGASYLRPSKDTGVIRTIELDDWIGRQGVSQVDFIKIDAEGMEVLVLNTAMQVLDAMQPVLYIDVSHEQLRGFGSIPEELQEILQRHRYRLFRDVELRQSRSTTYNLCEVEEVFHDRYFDLLAIPPSKLDRLKRLKFSVES